jgi:hypothetical protein
MANPSPGDEFIDLLLTMPQRFPTVAYTTQVRHADIASARHESTSVKSTAVPHCLLRKAQGDGTEARRWPSSGCIEPADRRSER